MSRELRTIFFKYISNPDNGTSSSSGRSGNLLRVMKTRKKRSISICVWYLRKRHTIGDAL